MGGRALVLACVAALLLATTASTVKAASGIGNLGPRHSSILPAPRHIDVKALPSAASSPHVPPPRPFLPRDAQQYAQAKEAAAAGKAGRRNGITTLKSAAASSTGVRRATQLSGFPLVNLGQQIGWFGQDQAWEPPDTQLAAGPSYLFAMDNDTGTIWTKSGALVSHFDLNRFFYVLNGYSFTDPRVLYDQESGRWLASGLEFDANFDSSVFLAVSLSNDPTGLWDVYTVASKAATILDQPMTGVSSDKVVVSWNDFNNANPPAFLGTETVVIQKSDFGMGGVNSVTFGPDKSKFRIVPAQSITTTSTEWMAFDNTSGGTIGAIAITGTPAANNVQVSTYPLSVAGTTAPPNAVQPGTGSPTIDAGDDRFLSAVWQNGNLWVSGNDACTPAGDTTARSCLRLMEVAAPATGASPTVTQSFDAGTSGSYLYYPALGLDGKGDLFAVFSTSDASHYGRIAATNQPLGASAGTLDGALSLQAGQVVYTGKRWGDYSGAAVDPADPSLVWVAGEYAYGANGNWGTAAAGLSIATTLPSTAVPQTISPPYGRTDVFWRGNDNALWHKWYDGSWHSPQNLGGSLASDPSPVASSPGVMDVFWKGTDGSLWHTWSINGTWYGPQSLASGSLGGGPHAVGQFNGVIDVFWRGTDNSLWHEWYSSGWNGPEKQAPSGSLQSDPSPVTSISGVLDVFWEGADGNLWHRWYRNGWYGPASLGSGPLGSGPQAVGQSNGVIDVFWRGTDNGLWHDWYSNGWHGPEQQAPGGSLQSDPSPVNSSSGVLDVFWKGADANLWHQWYSSGWYGPASLGSAPLGSGPEAVGQSSGRVDVFWRGTDNGLWHDWYAWGWYGPEGL